MPLSQALPPYTSMPISYLERSIKGAIAIPMHPVSKTIKPNGQAVHQSSGEAAGDAPDGGESPSELHQASIDRARAVLGEFKKASDGYTFIEHSMLPNPDIPVGPIRLRADDICLLELHQHGQRLLTPNFVLAANTDLAGNHVLTDLAFTKLAHLLCDEIEEAMPRGVQCCGIVLIGTRMVFFKMFPPRDRPGCFVSALLPSDDRQGMEYTEPILLPPRARRHPDRLNSDI